MRAYELMVILDPNLEERTVQPSLDTYLNVVRNDGGTVDNVDIWGRRRLAYEIAKNAELDGIKTITLSYTFFPAKSGSKPLADAGRLTGAGAAAPATGSK